MLKVPTSFSELRAVRHTLGLYQKQCPAHVAILLLATYLFMQVLNTEPTFVAPVHVKGYKVMLPVHNCHLRGEITLHMHATGLTSFV